MRLPVNMPKMLKTSPIAWEGKDIAIKCLLMNQLTDLNNMLNKAPVLEWVFPNTATSMGTRMNTKSRMDDPATSW